MISFKASLAASVNYSVISIAGQEEQIVSRSPQAKESPNRLKSRSYCDRMIPSPLFNDNSSSCDVSST